MPVKDKLADGEGARVLGMILAREGDYDGSYNLLWPYVKTRLDGLHQAEQDFEVTAKSVSDRQIQFLKNGQAPEDFYTKYKASSDADKQNMVDQFVNSRVKDDPDYASKQEALVKQADVVPVAMELGIVMLNQAQGQPDAERRKAELQSAEQVFLAIGGVASGSDTYRLSLGQVYYWLGKQADGRKLFDEYLVSNGRGFNALLELAMQYRQLGSDVQARAMSEEAYSKATTDQEKYSAAGFRSRCFKDLDDEIAWLEKSDLSQAGNKASLSQAKGDKALVEGRDQEAMGLFQSAIDAYASMPRSASSVNDTALSYYAMFQATGDRSSLDRCIDYFQQAVNLSPTDSVLIYNAASTILEGAIADVIGDSIDLRALHATGSLSTLGYLYNDQSSRSELVRKLKAHPGIQRTLSYFQKLMVIAPKKIETYESAYALHAFTRDEDALARAGNASKPPGSIHRSNSRSSNRCSAEKDAQNATELSAQLAKSQATLEAVRSQRRSNHRGRSRYHRLDDAFARLDQRTAGLRQDGESCPGGESHRPFEPDPGPSRHRITESGGEEPAKERCKL